MVDKNGATNGTHADEAGKQDEQSTALPALEVTNAYVPVEVSIRTLLEAGAHFGHKTERWNPKMLPYIFTEKNRVHIINLDLTIQAWNKARKFIVDLTSRGGSVLFVGTKQQCRASIERAAKRSGSYYVNNRWLGGTLSNFETIKHSLKRMRKLEELLEQAAKDDSKVKLAKKEKLQISRQLEKLEANLGGIRDLRKHPSVMFVLDINKEDIAVAEARKLHIPVVALVDTNTDPSKVTFPIPSNDDANRTIDLFVNAVADAVLEGRLAFESRVARDEQSRGKGRSDKVKSEVVAQDVAVSSVTA